MRSPRPLAIIFRFWPGDLELGVGAFKGNSLKGKAKTEKEFRQPFQLQVYSLASMSTPSFRNR